MVTTTSPHRRRSIAVLGQVEPTRKKRRASTLVPGEKQRLMAPRKSILKASLNLLGDEDDTQTTGPSVGSRKSLGRRVSFASHAHVRLFEKPEPKSTNGEGSSDAQQEQGVAPPVNDENAYPGAPSNQNRRKSALKRRRSSTGRGEDGEWDGEMDLDNTIVDPDIYLSSDDSAALSDGIDGLQPAEDESNVLEQGTDTDANADVDADADADAGDLEDEDAMDVTEAVNGDMHRRRSSTGEMTMAQRRRSTVAFTVYQDEPAQATPVVPDPAPRASFALSETQDMSMTGSFGDITGDATASSQVTVPTEYTVPLSQALNPPRPLSQEWLELAAATHSGEAAPPSDDTGSHVLRDIVPSTQGGFLDDDTGMSLDDALTRLQAARLSFGAQSTISVGSDMDMDGGTHAFPADMSTEDHSFDSSEDSFAVDGGDKTFNLTSVMRRASSLGGELARELGLAVAPRSTREGPDESMEITDILGDGAHEPASTVALPGRTSGGETMEITTVADASLIPDTQTISASGVFDFPRANTSTGSANSGTTIFSATSNSVNTQATLASGTAGLRSTVFTRPGSALGSSTSSNSIGHNSTSTSPNVSGSALDSTTSAPIASSRLPLFGSTTVFSKSTSGTSNRVGSNSASTSILQARRESAPPSPIKAATVTAQPTARRNSSAGTLPLPPNHKATAETIPSSLRLGEPSNQQMPRTSPIDTNGATGRSGKAQEQLSDASAGPVRMPGALVELRDAELLGDTVAAQTPSEEVPEPSLYPNLDYLRTELSLTPSRTQATSEKPFADSGRAPVNSRLSTLALHTQPSPKAVTPSRRGRPSRPSAVPKGRFSLLPGDALANTPERSSSHRVSLAPQADKTKELPSKEVSVDEFIAMTGITFMNDMIVPRRSSIHPSRLRRRSSGGDDTGSSQTPTPSMAEYYVAMAVHVPALEVYAKVAKSLQAWVDASKLEMERTNAEARKVPPNFFQEYMEAEPEDQKYLIDLMNILKENARQDTKGHWYDSRLKWTSELQTSEDDSLAILDQDARALDAIRSRAEESTSALEEELARLTQELADEQREVDEIEQCDQDYLNELRESVKEQTAQLEDIQREQAEAEGRLKQLDVDLAKAESQRQEASAAIDAGQRFLQSKGKSDPEDAIKQQFSELRMLEWLTQWHLSSFATDQLSLVYRSKYAVEIPQQLHNPVIGQIRVQLAKSPSSETKRNPFQGMDQLQVNTAQRLVNQRAQGLWKNSEVAQLLSDYWTSCAELRRELEALVRPYPHEFSTTVSISGDSSTFQVTIPVLYHHLKAKAFITFMFDAETYSNWPFSINNVGINVSVGYGLLRKEPIVSSLRKSLEGVDMNHHWGCLSAAIEDALALHT